jgi:hypothetical protein
MKKAESDECGPLDGTIDSGLRDALFSEFY